MFSKAEAGIPMPPIAGLHSITDILRKAPIRVLDSGLYVPIGKNDEVLLNVEGR